MGREIDSSMGDCKIAPKDNAVPASTSYGAQKTEKKLHGMQAYLKARLVLLRPSNS